MSEEIEMEKFARKHISPKAEQEKVEEKTYIDINHVMMVTTNKPNLVNVLNNYTEMDKEIYEKSMENIKENQTVVAEYDLDFVKDILTLLTKIGKGENVTIKMGDTAPITFLFEKHGEKIEITLAPRVRY